MFTLLDHAIKVVEDTAKVTFGLLGLEDVLDNPQSDTMKAVAKRKKKKKRKSC